MAEDYQQSDIGNPHWLYLKEGPTDTVFPQHVKERSKALWKDIVQVYCTKIHPVLEYTSPAWHAGLTGEQSDTLEQMTYDSYDEALSSADIPRLSKRRKTQCNARFVKMQKTQTDDKLNRIFLPPRSKVVSTRSSQKFNPPRFQTERFRKSVLSCVLLNWQYCCSN